MSAKQTQKWPLDSLEIVKIISLKIYCNEDCCGHTAAVVNFIYEISKWTSQTSHIQTIMYCWICAKVNMLRNHGELFLYARKDAHYIDKMGPKWPMN